jgi:cytochrome P450
VVLSIVFVILLTDLDKVTADVLGKMMMARDEETGQTMTDKELRDQVMTLMLAGHEVCS